MKTLKIITKIIYSLLFVFLITSATFLLLTTYDLIPKYNFYVVMSGSMEPAIRTGSIIGTREESSYGVDDIVTIGMSEDTSVTYTHRIVEIVEEEETSYITKGDANEAEDIEPVFENSIIGKTFFSIPSIGYVVNFAQQPTGFILMVIVPAIIIVASELNIIKDEFKKIVDSKKKIKLKEKEE